MNTALQNRAWATLLARHLTRSVVVSPGSRNTPLVLAFAQVPEVQVHCALDERTAGFFALGLARATQRAVVLLCTSGSAAAHYLPAVIEANHSGVPLIVLTADRPPELHQCGAPQTITQTHLFGEHVRWFTDIGAPSDEVDPLFLRSIAAQALDYAEGATPGPVHINVPMREPLWSPELPPSQEAQIAPLQIMRGVARLSQDSARALAQRLMRAPRGVIVAGGMNYAEGMRLRAGIGALAARLSWPVLPEATSQLRCTKGALATHGVSSYDALLRDAEFASAHAPALVLRFGQTSTSKIIGQWLADYARDRTILVHRQGRLHDPHHAAQALIIADPALLIEDVLPHIEQASDTTWLKDWQAAEYSARGALDAACADGFWEAAVAHEVHARLPAGGALHVASSMPIRDIDSFAPPRDIAFFANRGANGIDGTLASALGTAAGYQDGPTAVLLGDLSFLHDVGALQLARQLNISLTVVVVNNGGGGIFDFLGIAKHPTQFERFFRTPQQADITQVARAAGAHAQQVHDIRALGQALESSWRRVGLSVIEAVMPQSTNNVERHRDAWSAVSAAQRLP